MKKHLLCSALLLAMAAGAEEATPQPVPSVLALSTTGREAEILIYGLIGDFFWEGITALGIVERLAALDVDTIRVRINSRGGAVDEGLAIYNGLRRHPARVVVVVDGSAESIASTIAMAGDEVVMPPASYLMLHAPYTPQGGNAIQKRAQAEMLDTIADAMLEAYVAKAPEKRADIEAMLKDGQNHYLTAAQAIELGLADTTSEAAEAIPATAQAAALCSYISAIAAVPEVFASGLRGRIQATTTPQLFASLPEVTQRAVFAHIEDHSMKHQLQTILAAGPTAAPAAPASVPNPPPSLAANNDPAVAIAAAMTQLRERNAEIVALAQPHMANADVRAYVDTVIAAADPAVTAGDVGKQILALMAKGREPLNGGGHVVPGADDRDKQRTAMALAIEARAGGDRAEGSNPYRGHTLFELARATAERAGVNTRGMDRMDVVAASFTHSSSDFPLLLGDTARKALLRGFNDAPETFPQFTRPVSVSDFKASTMAGLGLFSALDVVPENGEYKQGTFSESGQTIQLATFGKLFGISRQAIINDDLGALSAVPRKMGAAAKRTVGDAVFRVLTSNPTMRDGVALFHADHANLATGAVISTTTVDGVRVIMAKQVDSNGNVVYVPLKYILTPVALGGSARVVRDSQFEVSGNKNLTIPNVVRGTFEVIDDARLDAASATAWYGVADPDLVDGIVVAYLDGKQEPYLESKDGWNVDGTEFKVRIDAAAAAADHRGLAKNPGA
jgi:ATP-dependent protease ClpP protease subunit